MGLAAIITRFGGSTLRDPRVAIGPADLDVMIKAVLELKLPDILPLRRVAPHNRD